MSALPNPRPFWHRRLRVPLLVLLGLNAAVFLVYTLPRTVRERTLASRLVTLRADVEREGRFTAALRKQAETVRSNTRDMERFYRQVVGNQDEDLLKSVEDLEKIASNLGLKPQRRSFKAEELKGVPLVRLVVSMPVSGTYRQLVSFLDRIERSPRFVIVDKVQLQERGQAGSDEADLRIVLSCYFRSETGASRGT